MVNETPLIDIEPFSIRYFEKELLNQALIMDKARKSDKMKKTFVFD